MSSLTAENIGFPNDRVRILSRSRHDVVIQYLVSGLIFRIARHREYPHHGRERYGFRVWVADVAAFVTDEAVKKMIGDLYAEYVIPNVIAGWDINYRGYYIRGILYDPVEGVELIEAINDRIYQGAGEFIPNPWPDISFTENGGLGQFLGWTIASIDGVDPASTADPEETDTTQRRESLTFRFDNGVELKMYHEEECCETVSIEDICGDLRDLIGSPLLAFECVSNSSRRPTAMELNTLPSPLTTEIQTATANESLDDSWTWTFYRMATIKGSVTIRWYGTSNGYYSETVDIKVRDWWSKWITLEDLTNPVICRN